MSWSDRRLSKFLSLLLRHRPGEIGLRLEPGGCARVDELIRKGREATGAPLSHERVRRLVEEQTKPRFSLTGDGQRIRANYGHSVEVDLDLEPTAPPELLYHGTAARTLQAILRDGLDARSRRYVHLSGDEASARTVGGRHGLPRVLRVRAARMHRCGHALYRAAEGIWLTESVPPRYLEFAKG